MLTTTRIALETAEPRRKIVAVAMEFVQEVGDAVHVAAELGGRLRCGRRGGHGDLASSNVASAPEEVFGGGAAGEQHGQGVHFGVIAGAEGK